MTHLIGARTGRACLVMFLAGSLGVPQAVATTLRAMDLREMVQAADRVVHARVTGSRVYWDGAHRQIYTDTAFEVLDVAKGQGPDRLTITFLGGRIDPFEMVVEGTPTFRVGEETVLMTTPRPDDAHNIVGFSLGVFRIDAEPRTGRRFVIPGATAGPDRSDPAQTAPDVNQPRPTRAMLPLGVFMERVRALASDSDTQWDPVDPRMRLVPVAGRRVTP